MAEKLLEARKAERGEWVCDECGKCGNSDCCGRRRMWVDPVRDYAICGFCRGKK